MIKTIFFLCVLSVSFFSACKKQTLMTYNSDNSIYFASSLLNAPLDSTIISFAFAGGAVTDSTIGIYVAVTGAPTAQDRPYRLVVDKNSSTAGAGVHYVAPATAQSIKAGKVRDTIYLKLLRTADMLDSSFKIVFRFEPNEQFNTAMEYKMLSPSRRLNYTQYTVYINDILRTPGRWSSDYLGVFTRKKLFLICELLNITPTYLDNEATLSENIFYGRFVQRYLNQMAADGNPIYEIDNSRMVMGRLVQ
jgi:hypothetical protein